MVRSLLALVAYLYLTLLDSRTADSPKALESAQSHPRQMMDEFHVLVHTNRRLESGQLHRRALPPPLDLRQRDYHELRYPYISPLVNKKIISSKPG
jgi:hypothetical protein